MRSLTNKETKETVEQRIQLFSGNEDRKWGTMTAHEAICHMADQLRVAMKVKSVAYRGNIFLRFIMKNLVLAGMPIPKGKVQTSPEMEQGAGGTTPVNFEKDKQALLKLINDFHYQFPPTQKSVHSAFGPMNREEWGRLAYSHLDHHLSQFGK